MVDENVFWISGAGGTVLRSTDGGKTLENVSVPDTDDRDFRDIHAFDQFNALVLNAGTPGVIFRTKDGGKSWSRVYKDDRKAIFFDAMDFWDRKRGIAFGDPIDGRMVIIKTRDGGKTWKEVPQDKQPKMETGEGGFAASGTCLICVGENTVLIGTGSHLEGKNEKTSRLLISKDAGETWDSVNVPLPRNQSSGIFSIDVLDEKHWVAVGGDYRKPDSTKNHCAVSKDGGKTWQAIADHSPSGFRSVIVGVDGSKTGLCFCAGTNGIDQSDDSGKTWNRLADKSMNVIAVSKNGNQIVSAGPKGKVYLGRRVKKE